MRMPRASAAASLVNGKIYVFGGCRYGEKENWGEVFDPKTQTWGSLPMLEEDDMITRYIHHSVVVEGKVYLVDSWNRTLVYYLPEERKWGRRKHLSHITDKRNWCVVTKKEEDRNWWVMDNLVYSCGVDGNIYWCEPEELDRCDDKKTVWHSVGGFEPCLEEKLCASRLVHFGGDADKAQVWKIPMLEGKTDKNLEESLLGARLTSFGQNLLLFWDEVVGKRLKIWCAEISLLRMDRDLLMGNIEWSKVILTGHPLNRPKLLYSVSVDV